MDETAKKVAIDADVADLIAGIMFPAEGPGLPVNLGTADPDQIVAMGELLAKARQQLA